jgi:hypothetical protein
VRLLALTLLATGCAAAYRPPAPFVPALDEPGEVVIATNYGFGGAQLDVAHAPVQGFAWRAGGQFAGFTTQGSYAIGTFGLGTWWSFDDGAGTLALTASGGGGRSVGVTDLRVTSSNDTTTTASAGEEDVSLWNKRNSGMLAVAALRVEGTWNDGEVIELGAQLGPTWHMLDHDPTSDNTGTGQMLMMESTALARFGPPVARLQLSGGMAVPLWWPSQETQPSNVGTPNPFVLALGLVIVPGAGTGTERAQ